MTGTTCPLSRLWEALVLKMPTQEDTGSRHDGRCPVTVSWKAQKSDAALGGTVCTRQEDTRQLPVECCGYLGVSRKAFGGGGVPLHTMIRKRKHSRTSSLWEARRRAARTGPEDTPKCRLLEGRKPSTEPLTPELCGHKGSPVNAGEINMRAGGRRHIRICSCGDSSG